MLLNIPPLKDFLRGGVVEVSSKDLILLNAFLYFYPLSLQKGMNKYILERP